MIRLVVVLLFGGLLQGAEPLRVLFLGNSYTYFNNAPEIFAELARAALPDRQVEVQTVAIPGATLVSLWERSDARRILRSSKWDYVVLQDQSQLGDGLRDGKFVVNAPILLHWGVRLFDAEVKRAGARTVLLLTWSRLSEPHQQGDLDYAYDSVARELGAILAPVGPAWQMVRQRSPGLELYAKDGSHPSPAGSYLLACVLLTSLFPEAARDLPFEVSGHAVSTGGVVDTNRNTVLVALSAEQARSLQNSARDTVSDIRRNDGYLGALPPERPNVMLPSGEAMQPDQLAGVWTGDLTYYPSPAILDLTLRFEGGKCQGDVVIRVPDRNQRYDAPLAECSLSGQELRFSVVTLPLPFLIDRFRGRITDGRLVGMVERTGRELTNSMSGTWALRRRVAQ
ncbi:MAG TPA: SGNH/GDSL hydrolase family protein [Bryobacteraceae bacterium]|nr:SGNH/GDSL hydrolase family protein [Bryobacteraceae bacterium]